MYKPISITSSWRLTRSKSRRLCDYWSTSLHLENLTISFCAWITLDSQGLPCCWYCSCYGLLTLPSLTVRTTAFRSLLRMALTNCNVFGEQLSRSGHNTSDLLLIYCSFKSSSGDRLYM